MCVWRSEQMEEGQMYSGPFLGGRVGMAGLMYVHMGLLGRCYCLVGTLKKKAEIIYIYRLVS